MAIARPNRLTRCLFWIVLLVGFSLFFTYYVSPHFTNSAPSLLQQTDTIAIEVR